jgi:hypothetical protein
METCPNLHSRSLDYLNAIRDDLKMAGFVDVQLFCHDGETCYVLGHGDVETRVKAVFAWTMAALESYPDAIKPCKPTQNVVD